MNKRFLGVLVFAFVVAASGGLITYRQLVNHTSSTGPSRPVAQIVLAAHDLDPGAILTADDVKLTDWPGPMPDGATVNVQDVVGRGVVAEIYAKEPVRDSRLAAKGAGGGLAAMIPSGMRAFAVRVNEVVGVSGFATPGMRVDVVINGTPPDNDASLGTLSRTLLQNVEVLSAGQDFKKDAEGKPVITQVVNLLVTPPQAEKLSLAANQTTVQLILRNPLDRDTSPTPGSALAYLFRPYGGKTAAAPRAAAPQRVVTHEVAAAPKKAPAGFTMEIISGTQKTEKEFKSQGGGN